MHSTKRLEDMKVVCFLFEVMSWMYCGALILVLILTVDGGWGAREYALFTFLFVPGFGWGIKMAVSGSILRKELIRRRNEAPFIMTARRAR